MATDAPLDVIAQLLKITPRRVQQLAREGTIPKAVKRRYDIVKCVHGYIDFLKKDKNEGASLTDERVRLTKINADRKALLLDKERGLLVPIESVVHYWGRLFVVFKTKLRMIPRKNSQFFSMESDSAKIEKILMMDIDEALEDLGDYDPGNNGDGPGKTVSRKNKRNSKARKTTSKTNSKRVGRSKPDSK